MQKDEVFIGVSTCFGHHHAHHQENGTKPTTLMVYSTGRAVVDSGRRGGSVCTCWDWFPQSQQVHTEPPLLPQSTAARPVLYTIGVVGFVLFSWWWAWWCPKYFETPINTSSSASSWLFIHLLVITSITPSPKHWFTTLLTFTTCSDTIRYVLEYVYYPPALLSILYYKVSVTRNLI
jgi:hypothetical protein